MNCGARAKTGSVGEGRLISIRPFEESDAAALGQMMLEMVRSYGAELPDEDHVEKDLIEHSKRIEFLLAFNGATLAGFATFVTLFPVEACSRSSTSNRFMLAPLSDASG